MNDKKTYNPLTYLSIDLDYWTVFPERFLNKIIRLNVPTAVSVEHHHLLPHVNQFTECTRLINIDHHADLCGNLPEEEELCDGTWGCRVEWRHKESSSFLWSYPEAECVTGKTNTEGSWCDNDPDDNPFFSRRPYDLCDWSFVSRRKAPMLTRSELASVVAVGICVSPDYLVRENIDTWSKRLFALADKHKLEIYDKNGLQKT